LFTGTGWVLDVPVIAGFAKNDPVAHAFVRVALEQNATLQLPAAAVATAYVEAGDAADNIGDLHDLPVVVLDALDGSRSVDAGSLLARARDAEEARSDWRALARAHICAVARAREWPIVTGDAVVPFHAFDHRLEVRMLWPRRPPKPTWQ